ncbi:MAG: DM13 domain-containing protein [Cyanobacteriota bacterium]|nr:DM13 domain-containing protein [Cyanobacteriota bacterium]
MKLKPFLVLNITLFFAVGCATQAPQSSISETPPPQEENVEEVNPSATDEEEIKVTTSGAFVTLEHSTQGEATLLTENGKQYVELSEDFQTDSGPDLVLVLHRDRQLENSALDEGDYLELAPLENVSGAQRYELPADFDLANYSSLAIWCREFNVTFGYAPLQS